MLSEEAVPVQERCLFVEGRATEQVYAAVSGGLPQHQLPNTILVFVRFAYADLPLGKAFQYIFPDNNPPSGVFALSRIVGVTQQFGRPFDAIPHGWKTICMIEFPHGVPELVQHLPTVNNWYESKHVVGLCTTETYKSLVHAPENAGGSLAGNDFGC